MSKHKRALKGEVTPAPKRIPPKVYTQAEIEALEGVFPSPGRKFKSAQAHFSYFMKLERERARRKVRREQKVAAA